MRPLVYLFDIDGTLVGGNGAGRRALSRVFGALHERPDAFDRIVFHGATDRAIMREALAALGRRHDEGEVEAALTAYVEELPRWVSADAYRAHAGVVEVLEALEGWPGRAIGLGTGNIEPAARIKLGPAGLNRFFSFGGFGSDAEARAELLEIGAARGAARLGVARAECDVLVIGDTPRDVEAAHAIGARCLAVATGGASEAELWAAGADGVVATLADERARHALISGVVG